MEKDQHANDAGNDHRDQSRPGHKPHAHSGQDDSGHQVERIIKAAVPVEHKVQNIRKSPEDQYHAQGGAVMAFRILDRLGMDPEEISTVITAIGNHDESTAFPVNPVAAALILADKTDVRYTRVRNQDPSTFDIHDRVNFSVKQSEVHVVNGSHIELNLVIDTTVCAVMDYFEIFMGRMILCRKAAEKLALDFRLVINGQRIL